jgi:predicted amidohydrolase
MATPAVRIALANVRIPSEPEESVAVAVQTIAEAGCSGAQIVCFGECFIPGYRWPGTTPPPPDAGFLESAWKRVAGAARETNIAVVLGTERVTDEGLRIGVLVINSDGTIGGWQDKEQLDPSEEPTYVRGEGRRIFQAGPLTFGIVICHEGFRYPETVRWAARRGAQLVFHPHADIAQPGSYRPTTFADPANSFHEKAMLCRAAENTCFFASVNCACEGSATTSAVIRPDGTVQCYQPYGIDGLLIAEIDLSLASNLFALRCRTSGL